MVILVSPAEPGNIGSAARAMRNYGAGSLRLVAPRCDHESGDARRLASGAAAMLREARIFDDLAAALADVQLSIAMTGVTGRQHPADCNSVVPEGLLAGRSAAARCALVLGREDHGLSGAEMELCQFLWTLPTNPAFPSMNLAAALAVGLAGLSEAEARLGGEEVKPPADPADEPADQEAVSRLMEHFHRLLTSTRWDDGRRTELSLLRIRNIFSRAVITRRETDLMHGVCSNALHCLDHPDHRNGQAP